MQCTVYVLLSGLLVMFLVVLSSLSLDLFVYLFIFVVYHICSWYEN